MSLPTSDSTPHRDRRDSPVRIPGKVRVLRNDQEAIAAAEGVAAVVRASALTRDRERTLPRKEVELLSASGLYGATVPRAFGGAEIKAVTVAEVFRILAAADPSVAQIPQNHLAFVETLREGTPQQQRFYFERFLAGERIGNALSEATNKKGLSGLRTRLVRTEGGYLINGAKAYCTGALFAHWVPIFALDENDVLRMAYVRSDAPGLTIHDDWAAMGQRTTASGTIDIENVFVTDFELVTPFEGEKARVGSAWGQVPHAAIDLGIAEEAFDDALEYIRTRSRSWHGSGFERLADEPLVVQRIGEWQQDLKEREGKIVMSNKSLWYTRCPVPTAFSIALRNGWLDDEFDADGIEVNSLLKSTDRAVRESHFDHTVADSFRHGGNTPPIWSRAKGNDVRLIGLSWTEQPQFLLTMPESGIRSAADLAGKRLALPRRPRDSIDFTRANYLQFYETALASVGLTLKDVALVDVLVDRAFLDESGAPSKDGSLWNAVQLRASQREEIAAYWRGEVDVLASSGPRGLENVALLGARIVHDISQQPERLAKVSNSAPYTFTVSGRLLKERPELVARLLARVLEAADWAKTHHHEAVRVVAQELGVAEEFVEASFGDGLSSQLEVNLSAENVAAIRLRKEFLLKHGFLPADFDLDQWIDPTPLAEAHKLLKERAQRRKQSAHGKTASVAAV